MTHLWTVYDERTGTPLRMGQTNIGRNVAIQASNPHEVVVQGHWPPDKYRFVAGVPVEVTVEPPPVTLEQVKAEQRRRLSYTDGYITRSLDPTDGRPMPAHIERERAAIRDGARRLEVMNPIPQDYKDPKYWGEEQS